MNKAQEQYLQVWFEFKKTNASEASLMGNYYILRAPKSVKPSDHYVHAENGQKKF